MVCFKPNWYDTWLQELEDKLEGLETEKSEMLVAYNAVQSAQEQSVQRFQVGMQIKYSRAWPCFLGYTMYVHMQLIGCISISVGLSGF